MSTTEKIGANVRVIARARGLSLRAVSKAMGFNNEQVLYTRLSGVSRMSVTELERLADILSVSVVTLLSDPSTLIGSEKSWLPISAEQPQRVAA